MLDGSVLISGSASSIALEFVIPIDSIGDKLLLSGENVDFSFDLEGSVEDSWLINLGSRPREKARAIASQRSLPGLPA